MLREDLPEDSRHGRMYIALRERGDGERLSKLLARKVLNGQFYRSVAHKGARGAQGPGAAVLKHVAQRLEVDRLSQPQRRRLFWRVHSEDDDGLQNARVGNASRA